MKPYFSDASTTIYHGDCLQIIGGISDSEIDSVITDPPYCSGGSLESQRSGAIGQGHRAARLSDGDVKWFAADNMTTGGLRVHTSERDHACQKPEHVMAHLIEVAVAPGGLVLDPFMGSGTTLVAAKQSGRRSIGIELDESNCEAAARRIQQEMAFA